MLTTKFPTTKSPAQFVSELYINAGVTPAADELTSVINEFGGAPDTADTAARACTQTRSRKHNARAAGNK